MKLTVHDLIVVEREIELPEKCPNCSHEFQEGDDLKVWEYQDQCRVATLLPEGGIDWPDLPAGGDCYLYISWHCDECDHVLLEHNTVSIPGEQEPPPGIKDLLNITE